MSESGESGGRKARPRMGRRDVVKKMVATAVAGAAGLGAPENEAEAQGTATAAEVGTAAELYGRQYTEAERELMARRVPRVRSRLQSLRAAPLPEGREPATRFDPRLPGAEYPRGSAGFRPTRAPAVRVPADLEELAFAPVTVLARLLRERKVTSTALTRMYLERLKKYGPRLLCVVTLMEEQALEQAARADRELAEGKVRGPLHGVPWGAKDLLATRGVRTTWGARPYEHRVIDEDATVVSRLDAAGAVLLAKLTMGELAQGDIWFGGMTRNPWKPEQGASGSSAGSGSATAAGLVGFAIGTETLGSIVSPSVRNGVTGLRPTYGRVSRHGAMSLCWTLDKIGPMCRAVEDCALVLHVLHGPDGQDAAAADVPFHWQPSRRVSDLKVGLDTAAFDTLAAERKPVYEAALEVLRGLGIQPRPLKLPEQTPAYGAVAGTIIDVESAASFARLTESGRLSLLARQTEGAWPNTFRVGSTVPAVDYLQALRVRAQLQRDFAAALGDLDLYLTVPFAGPTMAYTNLTGHPSLVTRCGMRDGLPESIELIGGLYQEEALLRVGLAFEQATTWHRQWPDVSRLPAVPPLPAAT